MATIHTPWQIRQRVLNLEKEDKIMEAFRLLSTEVVQEKVRHCVSRSEIHHLSQLCAVIENGNTLDANTTILKETKHECYRSHHGAARYGCYSPTCIAFVRAMKSVTRQAQKVNWIRSQLSTTDGWTLHRADQGITTYSRFDDDDGIVTIRAEGLVDAPLLNVLSVFYEVDLWSNWMPTYSMMGLKYSELLKTAGPTDLLMQMAVSLPWPLQTRDIVAKVHGVDCMDAVDDGSRQVVILVESVDEYLGREVPEPPRGTTRLRIQNGGLTLTPQCINGGGSGTHLQWCMKVDPRLAYIPTALINLVFRHLIFMFFQRLQKQALEVKGTEYETRLAAGGEFYDYIRKRLAEVDYPEDG
eukprot:m.60537 g.60537  ORF g.60537 m.60537 type:complete len:356 (-) comp22851_c0_seq1:507-1574(-)